MYITPRPIHSPVLADSLVPQNRHNRLQSEGTTVALLQQPSNRRDQNEHLSAPAKTFAQTHSLTDSSPRTDWLWRGNQMCACGATDPGCNLIGWTGWCFGAGGKKLPKKGINNSYCHFWKINEPGHLVVSAAWSRVELRKTVAAHLLPRTGLPAVLLLETQCQALELVDKVMPRT